MCNRCGGFEQDILIRKLVEKWWAPLISASESNKEAERNLDQNFLDEALKNCNQSLEKGQCLKNLTIIINLNRNYGNPSCIITVAFVTKTGFTIKKLFH